MFLNRVFWLYTRYSVIDVLSKANRLNHRPHYHKNLYHDFTKDRGSYWKTFKFMFQNNSPNTNSNCRCLFSRTKFSTNSNNVKLMTFSGILSFLYGKEEEKESELIMTIKRGILSIQREEFETAEQILHVALKLAQEQQNNDGVTYIYDLLANIAFEVGDWRKAEKLFVNVMQRELAKGIEKDDVKIIHMSLKLAKIYESTNDDEKAEQGFKFCLEKLGTRLKKDLENEDVLTLWAMTLDWYAKFLQQKNRMAEALVYYKKAFDMCVNIHGEIHEQSVILLNDIGTVTFLKGDRTEALEYMNKAVEIGKHLPNMEDLSSVYVNLGNIYLQNGMYREAKKSCTEGLQNATRHNNVEGQKEASICLEELKKMYKQ